MTPAEMRTELIHVAAEMVRGLHGDDIVFSKTTPWYVRARVEKVIDAADERSKVLAMRLKKVADALVARPRCEGCGNEIDPETCHCGDPIKGHSYSSGHGAVPMGCDCHRAGLETPAVPCIWRAGCDKKANCKEAGCCLGVRSNRGEPG
jgi:hypothetical protein